MPRLRRVARWPKRRLRCARMGHKWRTTPRGDDVCKRCGKRERVGTRATDVEGNP